MTDIHDLDRYIGRYVVISEGNEGGAGYLVDVSDNVNYDGDAFRWVTFDWGQGWPVREKTEITLADPPAGEAAPGVENPIDVMHEAIHASDGTSCESSDLSCVSAMRAYGALAAFRRWRMKQADQYWMHHYVDKLLALRNDPVSVTDLIREARSEGAPPHILERMQEVVDRVRKEGRQWSAETR